MLLHAFFAQADAGRVLAAACAGHVLGPGVLAAGKRLVAPAGSFSSAMTAAVTAPRAGSG